ncbi:unnamed protein product [Hymenolepis diminuta]|uniref:B30.2/SPRY domain-containing protein n=1 Tax=Hymenolepis diminuta TaxID=6216 RepID=A0A0R3STJ2_HYMDI|nr:unnamed protein product [Hymenolepis diminuta]VUZ49618.1 unnamed protein product [Hymenolepis diminuta]
MHGKCGNCGFKSNESDSILSCKCEDMEFEWVWDPQGTTSESCLFEDEKTILFHPKASNGTAVVRGTELLTSGIHYWEIKATTLLYGTDVMIGVGEKHLNLSISQFKYTSFLGVDDHSCGHSYLGAIHYMGKFDYNQVKQFAMGSVVGCLLDMFHKKLYFFVNRELSGYPITLKGNAYYPMVCSTAARTGVKLIYTQSFEAKLQHFIILENKLPPEDRQHPFTSLIRILLEDCWPLRLLNREKIPN